MDKDVQVRVMQMESKLEQIVMRGVKGGVRTVAPRVGQICLEGNSCGLNSLNQKRVLKIRSGSQWGVVRPWTGDRSVVSVD